MVGVDRHQHDRRHCELAESATGDGSMIRVDAAPAELRSGVIAPSSSASSGGASSTSSSTAFRAAMSVVRPASHCPACGKPIKAVGQRPGFFVAPPPRQGALLRREGQPALPDRRGARRRRVARRARARRLRRWPATSVVRARSAIYLADFALVLGARRAGIHRLRVHVHPRRDHVSAAPSSGSRPRRFADTRSSPPRSARVAGFVDHVAPVRVPLSRRARTIRHGPRRRQAPA